MKRKCLKRAGLLLALLMIISLLPAGSLSAFAEEPGQEIASAGLSLTLPKPGPTGAAAGQPVPAAAGVSSGSGFSVQSAQWFTSSGSTPSRFEAGEQYYAEILLAPETGYAFSGSCAVSIDSASVKSTALQADGSLRVLTANITLEGESGVYDVWVAGVRVTERNKNDVLGDGKVSYDPATATLTLNKAEISAAESAAGALILAQDLELTVKGSATLEAEDASLGIYSLNGSLKLEGTFNIKTGGPALFADKDLTVEDGETTAETVWKDEPCMKVLGNVTVKKGQLTVTGPGAGILAEGSFTLEEEGVVKATATALDCDSEREQYGLRAQSVVVNGGDLTAKGYTGGILGAEGLSVTAGVVQAEGKIYGILVNEGSLEIENAATRVTADGEGPDGAILAPSIRLGSLVSVKEPANGKVAGDGRHIAEADGSIAKHAVIVSDARRFTVSFDTLGGPKVASQTVLEGSPAQRPADPELSPFTFEGWYTDPSGGQPYDFSTPVTSDLSLKARWVAPVMASVKDSDGNEGRGGTVSLGGESYDTSLSANVWRDGGPYQVSCQADEGYTFDHWEDGLGKMLPYLETSFSFSVQDGPKVFVAVFMKDKEGFTITLDSDGGDPEYLTTETDGTGHLDLEEMEFLESAFTRDGYDLIGWSLTPGGKALNLETYAFSKDETIYALWAPWYCTVSFETDGGSAVPAQSVPYGGTAYEPDDPYKAGSSFEGWFVDPELTRAFAFSTPITQDMTLYAKWDQVVKYTVVSGGGSIYGKTSGKELQITVRRTPRDGECFKHFTGVRIDNGPLILGTDYTVAEGPTGGTVVTLLPEYLSTLNSGSHIITITFDDGKATTGLTVKAGSGGGGRRGGSAGDSPETGDPGRPMLWAGLLLASAMGLGAVTLSGRKLRRAAER